MRLVTTLLTFAAACVVATLPAFAQSPPSAAQFYGQALAAMRDLPQPANVAFTLEAKSNGVKIALTSDHEHRVWLGLAPGSEDVVWHERHRTQDYETEIVQQDGTRWVSARSFFDPTWYGTYRALREGMLGSQDEAPPVVARATPSPLPEGLKVIAVTSVMGSGIYSVSDAGAEMCTNGHPGHAVNLKARSSPQERQLTHATIDLTNMRFCALRFSVTSIVGFGGYVEQHYGDVGGYWMVTDGQLSGHLRVMGLALAGGDWRFKLSGVTFPEQFAADTFERPAHQ